MSLFRTHSGVLFFILILVVSVTIAGCTSNNALTQQELDNQQASSRAVTDILFDNDLDESASYNIRKDGFVVIKFDSSVSAQEYTTVVDQLRSSNSIAGVRAEQSGLEVCPLRR